MLLLLYHFFLGFFFVGVVTTLQPSSSCSCCTAIESSASWLHVLDVVDVEQAAGAVIGTSSGMYDKA
jgi:hypothetical protein